ncbi:hypothetical protein BU15DRAFT_82171 [Melanogaster broomeanus]|nr:hypothetical protein BU15DRAFT_82171 [Melanogaster broomeanus]
MSKEAHLHQEKARSLKELARTHRQETNLPYPRPAMTAKKLEWVVYAADLTPLGKTSPLVLLTEVSVPSVMEDLPPKHELRSLYSPTLYTVSADNTMNVTDVATGQRIKKIRSQHGINSLDQTMAGGAGIELIATGSDDGTVRIWEGGEEGGKQCEIGCPMTFACWSADSQKMSTLCMPTSSLNLGSSEDLRASALHFHIARTVM